MDMNYGGDAAEQIVRMSLDGVEVTARIAGVGAKNIAAILMVYAQNGQKTKGKARLSQLLKSGKELTVFSIPQNDLKKFAKEAKQYGFTYYVIKSKDDRDGHGTVDLMAKIEDAPKINRVIEKFKLATVDKAQIVQEITKERDDKAVKENPQRAGTERKNYLSGQNSEQRRTGEKATIEKESVRKKLEIFKTMQREDGGRTRILKHEGKER